MTATDRKRFTPDEDAAIVASYSAEPLSNVARRIGRLPGSVVFRSHALEQQGILNPVERFLSPSRKWNRDEDSEFLKRWGHEPVQDTANHFGRTTTACFERARHLGVTPKRERRICTVADCDKNVFGHGLCALHYERIRRQSEKYRSYHAAWRTNNPDKVRAYSRAWKDAHPEQRRQIEKGWKLRHSQRVREVMAAWQKANPERIRDIKHRRAETFPIRQHLINTPAFCQEILVGKMQMKRLHTMALLLYYANAQPHTGRKRVPINVEDEAQKWLSYVVTCLTAHSKEDWDRADYVADELYGVILAAPIVEIRAFTARLSELLEADERVPFYVWRGFKVVNENLLQKLADKGAIELKTQLARKVAELAERALDPEEWTAAMVGALQWRSEEDLAKVLAQLERGVQPRVRGRESCLFLIVGEGEHEAMVML